MQNQDSKKHANIDASPEQIEAWAQTITAPGDDPEGKTTAFLLLMKEFERAEFDRMRVESIVYIAVTAGFARSEQAHEAQDSLVKSLRLQAGLSNEDRPRPEVRA